MLIYKAPSCASAQNSRVRKPSTPAVSIVTSPAHHHYSSSILRCTNNRRLFSAHWTRQGPPQVQPAISPLACRSYSLEPVPTDLRIEAKEEDGTSNIDYDEENKVVRIPLSALGPEGQRRTKLVLFTCNKCGGRTARLVNPIAWDKGAVFGQCAKCGVWHVLSAPNKKIFEEIRYDQQEDQQ